MTLAELFVAIRPRVNQSDLNKSKAQVQNLGTSLGKYFSGFGAAMGNLATNFLGPMAALNGLLEFGKGIFNAALLGDELQKAGQRAGATAAEIQTLRAFTAEADVSTEDLAMGLRRLNVGLAKAAEGNKTFRKALPGQWWADQNGNTLNAYQGFRRLSDIFSKLPEGAEKNKLAIQLLGRGGDRLLQAMNKGAAGIDLMNKRLDKYNVLVSDGGKQSAALDDSLKELKTAWQGVMLQIAEGGFTEFLTAAFKVLAEVLRGISNGFKAIGSDTVTARLAFATLQVAFVAAGTAAAWFGGKAALAFIKAQAPLLPYIALIGLLILLMDEISGSFDDETESLGENMAQWIQAGGIFSWIQDLLIGVWDVFTNITDPARWNVLIDTLGNLGKAFEKIPLIGGLLSSAANISAKPAQLLAKAGKAVLANDEKVVANRDKKYNADGTIKDSYKMLQNGTYPGMAQTTPNMSMSPAVDNSQINISVSSQPGMDSAELAKKTAEEVAKVKKSDNKRALAQVKAGAH